MEKKVLLLNIDAPKKGKYQFFLEWFKEAWLFNGGDVMSKIELPYTLRMGIAKFKLGRSTFLRNKKKAILIIGGPYIDFTAFPYNYFYEVIPIFWDTWQKYHTSLISSLKRNKVKHAFFTQRSVAEMVKREIPNIETYWLPEGIKPSLYKKGKLLKDRHIDILQYGRNYNEYHHKITNIQNNYNYIYTNHLTDKIFNTFEDLTNGISDAKINICFPRSYTHPEISGGIETLTQRYWEGILSRNIIVGHAPQELVDFMGYNPVIEVDFDNAEKQLLDIINNIEDYQDFVDNNYLKAVELCSWDFRIREIKNKLKNKGYKI